MAPPLLLLLLPVWVFTTGSVQEDSTVSSSTIAAHLLDMNQTSVTQRTTQRQQSTADRIDYIIEHEDYEDDEDEKVSAVSNASPVINLPCPYNRCEHLAPTCEEIQRHAGGNCLCPGIDGPKIKPESPVLEEVLLGDTEMTVNWCSPLSTVSGYRVLYGEPQGSLKNGAELNASFRSYTINNLHLGSFYMVCVVAFNKAGESQVDEIQDGSASSKPGPCRTVHTTIQSLYIGIAVGLAAVAGLLIILGYFLCRRNRNKTKMETKMEERGISNYIYKAGSIDQL